MPHPAGLAFSELLCRTQRLSPDLQAHINVAGVERIAPGKCIRELEAYDRGTPFTVSMGNYAAAAGAAADIAFSFFGMEQHAAGEFARRGGPERIDDHTIYVRFAADNAQRRLRCGVHYCTGLFRRGTIDQFIDGFLDHLRSVADRR